MPDSPLTFLPWLRSGLEAMSESDNDGRRKVSIPVNLVDENGQNQILDEHGQPLSISQSFILKGPGEVLGFNPNMVARTEPKNGANDFEPNYFPFVEFYDPDFPWRYFVQGDDGQKVIPWIALLVLKKNEFKVKPNENNKLPPILVVNKDLGAFPLPDSNQAWAWAHVQLSGIVPTQEENYNDDIEKFILENPGLNCSRLMCLRKLEPLTLYTAFVVPTSNKGRLAGLGKTEC